MAIVIERLKFAAASLCFFIAPAWSAAEPPAHAAPFANLAGERESYAPMIGPDGAVSALAAPGRTIQLPPDFTPLQALPLQKDRRLIFGRTTVLGHFAAVLDESGAARRLLTGLNEQLSLHFHLATMVDGRIFVLVYDAPENSPSGRRQGGTRETTDIYEAVVNGDRLELTAVKRELALGGLDVAPSAVRVRGGALVCTQIACVKLSAPAGSSAAIGPVFGAPANHPHKQLLELASDGTAAFGLFQAEIDDRFQAYPDAQTQQFSICRLAPAPAARCTMLAAGALPFNLRVVAGAPQFETVSARSDAARLLKFDLERLRGGGLAHFGETNLEGRLVWSAAYYLNGLITLAQDDSGLVSLLGPEGAELQALARARVRLETEAVARRSAEPYPWYYTKRYSLEREPIVSLVHIGRLARLLARARPFADHRLIDAALADLSREIAAPDRAIERFSGPQSRPELRYRKHVPFWADGSNVPWNYQSAWIEGGFAAGAFSGNKKARNFALACAQRFISEEQIEQAETWNYSAGDFLEGWSAEEGVSANLPAWSGDKANTKTAHISYRSMDAMALLALRRKNPDWVSAELAAHLARLVENGRLYPFVQEELVPLGLKPALPPAIARLYARSALPWQVQNQVWALAALAQDLPHDQPSR